MAVKKKTQTTFEYFLVQNIEPQTELEALLIEVSKDQLNIQKVLDHVEDCDTLTKIDELISLLNHSHLDLKEISQQALEKLGDKAVPSLYDRYMETSDAPLQTILINIGKPSSEHILKHNQTIDLDPRLIQIIGEIGDPETSEFLATLYEKGKSTDTVTKALINVGESTVPYLIDSFYNGRAFDEMKTITIISQIGGPQVKKLIPLIHDTAYKSVWPEIIEALQLLDDPDAEKIVQEYNQNILSQHNNEWKKRAQETKTKTFQ